MERDDEELQRTAALLKALAHPVRLCIARGLWRNGCCNVTQMQQNLAIPQSTVSQHLAKLRQAGVIAGRRKGLEICYEVSNPQVEKLLGCLFGEGPRERKEREE